MEFIELVSRRRSCRKFINKPVEREKIIKCVEAARLAPSACNAQPWKFIVVDGNDAAELKGKVVHEAAKNIYRFSKATLQSAPVIIVVIADKPSFLSKVGSLIRNTNFYLLDIGIACEHLVLQATELGLGSCYIGWFNESGVKKVLNVPKNMSIPLLICLGYPDESYTSSDRVRLLARSDLRKALDEILSFNRPLS
jgi:nitroreductase